MCVDVYERCKTAARFAVSVTGGGGGGGGWMMDGDGQAA